MDIQLTKLLEGLLVVGLAILVYCLYRIQKLKTRVDSLLGGSTPDGLEKNIKEQLKKIALLEKRSELLEEKTKLIDLELGLASQKIAIIRFNPFEDTGGDQSFALAALDRNNSGYVLTSIHGRGGTRVYIKPIDYGKSRYNLSSEEAQALKQASKRIIKKGGKSAKTN